MAYSDIQQTEFNRATENAKEKIFQWVGIRKYICIGRHIEGITLNPYERLMEKSRKVKLFENEVEAKAYLRTNGYSDEVLEFLKFEEVWR